jgi:hypothetical protein
MHTMKMLSGLVNTLMYYDGHETDDILIGVCEMSPEKKSLFIVSLWSNRYRSSIFTESSLLISDISDSFR